MEDPIVIINSSGSLTVGRGYTIGQVLKALEEARSAILNIVLRPIVEQSTELANDNRSSVDQ